MNKLKIGFIILNFSIGLSSLYAEEGPKEIVYKYKEYELIDLGSLEVKGEIIAPGDLTIRDRERPIFKRSLLEKKDFDFENKREIQNLR